MGKKRKKNSQNFGKERVRKQTIIARMIELAKEFNESEKRKNFQTWVDLRWCPVFFGFFCRSINKEHRNEKKRAEYWVDTGSPHRTLYFLSSFQLEVRPVASGLSRAQVSFIKLKSEGKSENIDATSRVMNRKNNRRVKSFCRK